MVTLWEEELVRRAKVLKVNAGTETSADLDPVISKEVLRLSVFPAKDQICRLVQSSVENGARLLLDGRHIVVPGYENGNFVAPTILCDVTIDMECYKEEIFGTVLLCLQANNLDEAISIINKKQFQNEVEAGLVGINVTAPVPLPFSSFSGSNASFAGDLNFCGKEGVQFYTQIKTVAQQWKEFPSLGVLPSASPADMGKTDRHVSSSVPPPDRHSPREIVSQIMPVESESNSPAQGVQIVIPDLTMSLNT
ncbi:hypothetical protein K1719_016018 [Acacia pycnantha]|nr:hypothetical protein K1719_016018 [Acacia pycnantha]